MLRGSEPRKDTTRRVARCKLREARGLAGKLSSDENAFNERRGDGEEGKKPAAFQICVAAVARCFRHTQREDRGSNKAGS